MNDIDILKSFKNMHVPLHGKIDGVNLLEEVEMLRNITPENGRSYNALKCVISNNFTGPYLVCLYLTGISNNARYSGFGRADILKRETCKGNYFRSAYIQKCFSSL
jgi:hypothetical protein